MLDKQKLRESISQVLDANSFHEFKYIDEEILISKEFIQKIFLFIYERSLYNEGNDKSKFVTWIIYFLQ